MKRLSIVWIGLAVLLMEVGNVSAQSPTYTQTRVQRPNRNATVDNSAARQFIQQRATYHARQRSARMELQKWWGISPLRPAVSADPIVSQITANRPYVLGAPYYYSTHVGYGTR